MGVASFVPNLIIAIVIFVIGWIVGSLLGRLVSQLVKSVKIDNALKSAGVETLITRAGFTLDSGAFVGALVRWFFIIVFLVASLDVLGLTQVNVFLQDVVLGYLPKVIVAVLILLVAAVVAEAMQKVVIGAAKAGSITSANFLGSVTKWAIWIFAVFTALIQLNIATAIINALIQGVVIAVSLAVGLAFGLGGQEHASRAIERIKNEVSHRNN